MKFPQNISKEQKKLWISLVELHHLCRSHTKKKYNRINPFYEDLFEWSERGSFAAQEDKGITIYNSATVIGDVKIGESTWVGPFTILDGGGGLEIGRFCSISAGCQLLSHDTIKWALSGGNMSYEYEKTKIGDCCFIGTMAVIDKGVTIGNHCVIGAGAVVTKDVKDCMIVAGVPAQPVGQVKIDSRGNVDLIYEKMREEHQ